METRLAPASFAMPVATMLAGTPKTVTPMPPVKPPVIPPAPITAPTAKLMTSLA